jgi:hypothetical protein
LLGGETRMSALKKAGAVLLLLFPITACTVHTVVVERRPPCAGGVWIEGHYGPRGRWHPGHWRCPGVIEVVEVD